MNMETSAVVRLGKNVLIQEVGEGAVLLNLNTELYFTLDEVGTRMVKTLQECGSLAEAADKLVQIYEVDKDRLLEDLTRLVEECQGNGLLEVKAGSATKA